MNATVSVTSTALVIDSLWESIRLQTRKQAHPELVVVERGVMASNGLAWSPDGRTVYWADTARHMVKLEVVAGTPCNSMVSARTVPRYSYST